MLSNVSSVLTVCFLTDWKEPNWGRRSGGIIKRYKDTQHLEIPLHGGKY